eukprot:8419536-Pyramimonas_sp.AAC.1
MRCLHTFPAGRLLEHGVQLPAGDLEGSPLLSYKRTRLQWVLRSVGVTYNGYYDQWVLHMSSCANNGKGVLYAPETLPITIDVTYV